MAWNGFERIRQWYIFGLARRLPACKDITEMLSQSMDRKLPLGERIRIRLHLHICMLCMRYKDQLMFLRKAFRRYRTQMEKEKQSAPTLPDEVRERMKRSLML